MSRALRPPIQSPDFIDEMHEGLERVAAVADLLALVGVAVKPELLRDQTIAGAAGIIGGEADRLHRLLREHEGMSSEPPNRDR